MESNMSKHQKEAFECLFKQKKYEYGDFNTLFGHTPIKRLDELTISNRLQMLENFIPRTSGEIAMIYGSVGTSTGFKNEFYQSLDTIGRNLETLDETAKNYDKNDRFAKAFIERSANSAEQLAQDYAIATLDDMAKYGLTGQLDVLADKWHVSPEVLEASGIMERFGKEAERVNKIREIVDVPFEDNVPHPKKLEVSTESNIDNHISKSTGAFDRLKDMISKNDQQIDVTDREFYM